MKRAAVKMRVVSKTLSTTCLLFCFLSLTTPSGTIAATSPTVSLKFHKRFGFAAFSDISGAFTLFADVSPDIVLVEFYLNNQIVLNATATPIQ